MNLSHWTVRRLRARVILCIMRDLDVHVYPTLLATPRRAGQTASLPIVQMTEEGIDEETRV